MAGNIKQASIALYSYSAAPGVPESEDMAEQRMDL